MPAAVVQALGLRACGALPAGLTDARPILALAVASTIGQAHNVGTDVGRIARGVGQAKPWQAEALPLLAHSIAAALCSSFCAFPVIAMLLFTALSMMRSLAHAGLQLLTPAAVRRIAVGTALDLHGLFGVLAGFVLRLLALEGLLRQA